MPKTAMEAPTEATDNQQRHKQLWWPLHDSQLPRTTVKQLGSRTIDKDIKKKYKYRKSQRTTEAYTENKIN